jgi:hypothetical protein
MSDSRRQRSRFTGAIAGLGTSSGIRFVVGRWSRTPWGPFSDVMVERADGHRLLLAPDERVADFVQSTYTFDEVVRTPVLVEDTADGWHVETDQLDADLTIGGSTALGGLLRRVPERVATAPWWAAAVDPLARVLLRGVRTRGSAGSERREWYAATDVRRLVAVAGTWCGQPLGELRPVDPPVRFGFSSTPRTPAVTSLVTTIEH